MTCCQECGKPTREKELVLIPERDDSVYVICKTCWDWFEDAVDTLLDERILERKEDCNGKC